MGPKSNNYMVYALMNTYSTGDVARKIGVHKMTLLKWLWAKKIPEPAHRTGGGQDVRLWSERDLDLLRKFKETNYCKGRGRKKKASRK